jgi:hypothetical protein
LRPLRRRAARIARPARVRMRRRNPWVFARRRLFGWKVRLLTTGSPDTARQSYCPRRGLTARRTHPQLTGDLHRVRHALRRACMRVERMQVWETFWRHAKYVRCLPTPASCGMRHGLLACVLLVGQGSGSPLRRGDYGGASNGFRCGPSYLRAQLWTTLWMLLTPGPLLPLAYRRAAPGLPTQRGVAVMVQGRLGEQGGEGCS